MDLRKALDTFYYSSALCDLKLMNKKFVDENITYNSLLYLELIYTMNGKCTASKIIKQGLVTKTNDPHDKRKNYLFVNEEAAPQYKVFRRQDNEVIKRITDKYSDKDIQNFCEMLNIMSEINFEEINGGEK